MNYSFKNEIDKSNKRLKVGPIYGKQDDVAQAAAFEKRLEREARKAARRVQQMKEDRERYIIPEFQDLEEQLTTHL